MGATPVSEAVPTFATVLEWSQGSRIPIVGLESEPETWIRIGEGMSGEGSHGYFRHRESRRFRQRNVRIDIHR
jgi:hypothetical protein